MSAVEGINAISNSCLCLIAELKRALLNIRLDLQQFDQKYPLTTNEFYQQFRTGSLEDTEDFMIWAGIYEMFQENTRKLQELR